MKMWSSIKPLFHRRDGLPVPLVTDPDARAALDAVLAEVNSLSH
jgi:hypothetical protein